MTPNKVLELFRKHGGKAERPCPQCAEGIITLQTATTLEDYHPGYHVRGTPLPTRERECLVAACNVCEFVVEVKP